MDSNQTIQPCSLLLELSPDWLILRASENAHSFLGEYHQRLIGEPLADFTLAQPLHDLRNSLSRQRGGSGLARAYRVRLTSEPRYFDIAFQALEKTILLEILPSADQGFGEWLGSVSRLVDGLDQGDFRATLDSAARRMRALTGFDRVTLFYEDEAVESSRGKLPDLAVDGILPAIVANSSDSPIAMFPNNAGGDISKALLRSPSPGQIEELRGSGLASALCVPIVREGEKIGAFQCVSRLHRPQSFELHAAAELFAQIVGIFLPNGRR